MASTLIRSEHIVPTNTSFRVEVLEVGVVVATRGVEWPMADVSRTVLSRATQSRDIGCLIATQTLRVLELMWRRTHFGNNPPQILHLDFVAAVLHILNTLPI